MLKEANFLSIIKVAEFWRSISESLMEKGIERC